MPDWRVLAGVQVALHIVFAVMGAHHLARGGRHSARAFVVAALALPQVWFLTPVASTPVGATAAAAYGVYALATTYLWGCWAEQRDPRCFVPTARSVVWGIVLGGLLAFSTAVLLRSLGRAPVAHGWLECVAAGAGAIAEEVLFRGCLQRAIPGRASVVVTAAVFALLHVYATDLPMVKVAQTFAFAMALGVVSARFGLTAAIVAHVLWNVSAYSPLVR